MKLFCADWVIPMTAPPIAKGAVLVDDHGRIVEVGPEQTLRAVHPSVVPEIFDQSILMPGLVNAHTHLELSMMKDAVPRGLDFPEWAFRAITGRIGFPEPNIRAACEKSVRSLKDCGTIAVGDISNHSATALPYLRQASLYVTVFNEVTGFASSIARARFDEFISKISGHSDDRIRHTIAPHAAYSVSPNLFELVRQYIATSGNRTTVHLAESTDEIEFLQTGEGRMKSMIQRIGRWDDGWRAPKKSPTAYLYELGFLTASTLVVHAVHLDDNDITLLSASKAHVCTCPRSNAFIAVGGHASVPKMLDAGLNVCIGTDSLASNDDLNLWNEMQALRSVHPGLSAETVLRMATINGAQALGFDDRIGSISPGKDAAMIAVQSQNPVADPFDYLLQGFTTFKRVTLL